MAGLGLAFLFAPAARRFRLPLVAAYLLAGIVIGRLRLAVLAIALGVAYGATRLFGVSFALGAFFAGLVTATPTLSQQPARETLPW